MEALKKKYLFRRKDSKIDNLYSSNEKEVTRIDENEVENTKNISYIIQFIDSARFIVSSLSNLVNNRSEGIHRIKCKFGHDDEKCETFVKKVINESFTKLERNIF